MASDASIYSLIRPQAQQPGPMDSYAQGLQLKALMGQQDLHEIQRRGLLRDEQTGTQLRELFARNPEPTDAEVMAIDPLKAGPAYLKQKLEKRKLTGDIKKTELESFGLAAKQLRDMTASVNDDAGMAMLRDASVRLFGPEIAQKMTIPQTFDPAWKSQQILTADKLLEQIEKSKDRSLKAVNEPFNVGPDGQPVPNMPVQNFQINKAKAGKPDISTKVTLAGETEEAKAVGKAAGEMYVNLMQGSMDAQRKIDKYDRIAALLNGVSTGKLTPAATDIAAVADSIGLKIDPKLGPKQAIEALSNEIALEARNPSGGAGMPGALSDKDREFLKAMTPGIAKTPEGNALLIETAKKLAKRNIDVANLAREYRKKNGRLDEGFYTELQRHSAENPLFSPADGNGGKKPNGVDPSKLSDAELKRELGIK